MLPYIRCTTCGSATIGNVALIFEELRNKKIKEICEKHNISPLMLSASPHGDIDLVDIFEELHIDHICCRMSITSNIKFIDYYNPRD
jgi:DNA-directed RNA polymerase subunit N (RpoN/RPB10)